MQIAIANTAGGGAELLCIGSGTVVTLDRTLYSLSNCS